MALQQTKFKAWIARRLLTPPLADRFELHHVSHGSASLVCRLDAAGSADVLAAALCRQVSEETNEHVTGLEGRQQYVVRALAAGQPCAEFSFYEHCTTLSHAATELAAPVPEFSDTNIDANVHKAVAVMMVQGMRHAEALTRQLVELSSRTGERDARIIAEQQATIDRHEARRHETHELLEGLLSKAAEREHERAKYESEEARRERMFKTITEKFLPGLAHKWGIPMPPVASGAATPAADGAATVKRMFSKLPEEMQTAILDALGEEDASALMEAFGYPARPGSEATH